MTAERPLVDMGASCACGAIRVTARGPVLSMLLCSCEDCQRATGAGHAAVFAIDRTGFAVEGETAAFSRPADSGATFTRHFCPRCGTPIYGESSRAARLVLVPVGLFGAAAATWYHPTQLIFARSHRDWDSIAAGLPRHATYRNRETT